MSDDLTMKDRYFSILDSFPEHVFVFSESGTYLDVFGGADNDIGFDHKSFIGKTLYDVAPKELAEKFHGFIKQTLELNRTNIVEYRLSGEQNVDLPKDVTLPDEIWVQGTIKPLPWLEKGERTVVWMAKNITQQHLLEQRLKAQSETDELTGIPNRRALMQFLSREFKNFQRYGTETSLLMMDIDHFKKINDELGHQSGDEAIQCVAKLCQQELRDVDYIGRIGGEEFAIVLTSTGLEKASEVAERLRHKVFSARCCLEDFSIDLSISVGVAQVKQEDDNIKYVLSRADKAMYLSKRNGRNRVSVYA